MDSSSNAIVADPSCALIHPLNAVPPSREGFYAINNQFLRNGPKGFWEFKTLENGDMYVRIDLPGVPKDGVKVLLEDPKVAVNVHAQAAVQHKHDNSDRQYLNVTGLVCACCKISDFTSDMSDGVLRLLLSTTPQHSSCLSIFGGPDFTQANFKLFVIKDLRGKSPYAFPHGTNPQDPMLTGRVLQRHPCVVEGSDMAYESKQLQDGSLYVRLDMPGVPKDNFTVSVKNGRVKVTGLAPAVSHDSAGRFYSGDVALLAAHVDITSHQIETIAKNGVIRLIIPPA